MKKQLGNIFLIISFLWLCMTVTSQTNKSTDTVVNGVELVHSKKKLEVLAQLCKRSFEEEPAKLDSLTTIFKQTALQNGDSVWVYKAYQMEGLVSLLEGDLGSAIGAHQLALKWVPSFEPLEGKIKIINNIAGFHTELGNYDKALLFNKGALDQVHLTEDQKFLGKLWVSRAIIYDLTDAHDSAVYYADLAVDLAIRKNDSALLMRAEAELQDVMLDTGNVIEAIANAEQKLSILRKAGRPYSLIAGLQRLGDGYVELGEYDQAIERYSEANELAMQASYTERISATFGDLANAYISLGDFEKAEEALKNYRHYLKELHSRMMPEKMEVYNLQQQLAEKRLRNELLEKQSILVNRLNASQRMVIIIGTTLFSISLLLLVLSIYFRRKLTRNNRHLEDALNQVNQQKALLESRVHQRTAELELRNKQLQNHSYELSHKLRASVARIQAATSLFVEESDEEDQKRLVKAIEFSAYEADDVIRGIITQFNSVHPQV